MSYRISPVWWPIIGLSSPLLAPMLLIRNRRFRKHCSQTGEVNRDRIAHAQMLPLPELDFLDLLPLVEFKTEPDFLGAAGVSYLFTTSRGSLLFDVGYGPEDPSLVQNAQKVGFSIDQADALVISHLHPDHMGGIKAYRQKRIHLPPELGAPRALRCFLPDKAHCPHGSTEIVQKPQMLTAGIASTGPLARSLFIMGWTEEQALVARLKGKGLVIFTGCGHPTIEIIIDMAKRLSSEPIYAIGGGLHFPVTDSPLHKGGLKVQMILGTGKPPWQKISAEDLSRTIATINDVNPRHVFLSAHDTCDHALSRFADELNSEVSILRAGAKYRL